MYLKEVEKYVRGDYVLVEIWVEVRFHCYVAAKTESQNSFSNYLRCFFRYFDWL